MIYVLSIFLPLIGAAIAGLLGPWARDRGAQTLTCGAMLLAAIMSVFILYEGALKGQPRTTMRFSWIASDTFDVSWSLLVDSRTAVMVF